MGQGGRRRRREWRRPSPKRRLKRSKCDGGSGRPNGWCRRVARMWRRLLPSLSLMLLPVHLQELLLLHGHGPLPLPHRLAVLE